MLALSIVSPNGANIAAGRKTLEIRTWRPPQLPLRDPLIIENRIFLTGEDEIDPAGIAVAVVDIEEVHAWQPWQLEAACTSQWTPDRWAWHVSRVRPIAGAFHLPAQRKLYHVVVSDALLACLN
ncbi:ASCH domain-containing protein [Rhodanobacter sp. C03]|uniref:ASCH domain-containing protein n=1 Tax=Rhodanobacter sp. C03 TaxID=1945858 RepID=UPI000984453E|nr:ASCH domain-containing protein [Rhodanobacter sp. C03]OOG55434.1 RNA-binding protein [Rhodanobacter sp. C03]